MADGAAASGAAFAATAGAPVRREYASMALTEVTVAASGMVSVAPGLMRLGLPSKACGLLRYKAQASCAVVPRWRSSLTFFATVQSVSLPTGP